MYGLKLSVRTQIWMVIGAFFCVMSDWIYTLMQMWCWPSPDRGTELINGIWTSVISLQMFHLSHLLRPTAFLESLHFWSITKLLGCFGGCAVSQQRAKAKFMLLMCRRDSAMIIASVLCVSKYRVSTIKIRVYAPLSSRHLEQMGTVILWRTSVVESILHCNAHISY